jgi:hypothetical protein
MRILVQAGRQSDAVRESQPSQLDRVFHPARLVRHLQGRPLRAGQRVQRQLVRRLGIQAKQKSARQRIGDERHWIIPAKYSTNLTDFPR